MPSGGAAVQDQGRARSELWSLEGAQSRCSPITWVGQERAIFAVRSRVSVFLPSGSSYGGRKDRPAEVSIPWQHLGVETAHSLMAGALASSPAVLGDTGQALSASPGLHPQKPLGLGWQGWQEP